MRHRVKGRKLSRKTAHRKATLQALAKALILEKSIVTTVAKAKELRVFVEPLITKSKEDIQVNRSVVFAALHDKEAIKELFDVVAPKVGDRPGGYTRIVKAGFRGGDGADLAVIELVDFNESETESKGKGKKRTRRSGSAKKAEASAKTQKATKSEEPKDTQKEEVKAEVEETKAEEAKVEDVKAEEPKVDETESEKDSE